MQQINSPRDFEAMLHAERAVVFIGFEWSGPAKFSQKIFAESQKQTTHHHGQVNYSVYELMPDPHPFTWKWVGDVRPGSKIERGYGSVIWLRKGIVVASVADAGRVGIKTLARVTDECFAQGKPLSAELIASLQNEPVPFDVELLKILCCPETHQGLALAEAATLDKLNQRFAAGQLRNRGGQPVAERIQDGLIRADGRYLYPMRRNIPILLVDEAIPIDRFGG